MTVTPGEPPGKNGKEGGSGARPEDTIPAQTEEAYKSRGSVDTGLSYAAEQRKFLNWLRIQGLHFGNMPATAADKYLTEHHANPVTRNKWASALDAMFTAARGMGIQFAEQQVTRYSRPKKEKAPAQPMGPPPPAQIPGAVPYLQTIQHQPPVASTAAAQVIAPVEAPVIPAAPAAAPRATQPPQQKPVETFPSLGKRIRVSKISDGSVYGVPPGHEIPIGIYQKEQVEIDGSLENFLMFRIRPIHGPKPGQNPVVYRVQQLDTAMKPLPGQLWDIPVASDISGGPVAEVPVAGMPGPTAWMQPGQQAYAQQPAPAPAPRAEVTPSVIMEKLLDRALQAADREREEYDRKRKMLEEKQARGEIDHGQLMYLMSQLQPPKQVDPAELRRQLREELNAAAPPQPVAAAPAGNLGTFFDAPKGPDPVIEKLMGQVESLNAKLMEMASKPPQQGADPLDTFAKMMALMKSQEKPDPLRDMLAQLTLKQLTEPQKPKGLADVIAEIRMMKEAGALLGGGESAPPSFGETVVEVIGAVAENADKIGDLLGKLRGGAVKGAIRESMQKKQGQRQLAPGQQQSQSQAQQQYNIEKATAEAFISMLKLLDDPQSGDDVIAESVIAVISQLREEQDPRGKLVSDSVIKKFNEANTRMDLQEMVLRFFHWVGANKMRTEPRVTRLTALLHTHYSTIFGLLNNGAEKVLSDAQPAQDAQPAEPATAPAAEGAQPEKTEELVEETDEAPGEDDGEDEEGDVEEEEDEATAKTATA